jgi:hypothetical protein
VISAALETRPYDEGIRLKIERPVVGLQAVGKDDPMMNVGSVRVGVRSTRVKMAFSTWRVRFDVSGSCEIADPARRQSRGYRTGERRD